MSNLDLASVPAAGAGQDALSDLRLRLGGAQRGEQAARREIRRMARQLAVERRLLSFYLGTLPPAIPDAPAPAADAGTILLSEKLIYHLDTREDLGTHTAITGWAFRPAPGWDARATRTTLLLRHGDTVYATACEVVPRPDVAAFYAGRSGASGGAAGLESVGFACKILHGVLPGNAEWKIILRLECAGRACEQFTGDFLRS